MPRTPVDFTESPHTGVRFADVDAVVLSDSVIASRRQLVRDTTLHAQYHCLREHGVLGNFEGTVRGERHGFRGPCFADSDAYKWLEAASWFLASGPDYDLGRLVDDTITKIAAAQCDDGYLNTYVAMNEGVTRWSNFDLHELYCAGHLIQAAVAHKRVTGQDALLRVATRFATHISETFGDGPGRIRAVPGHAEIETALIELYRCTRERGYLETARFFIENRGYGLVGRSFGMFEPSYAQDHMPIRSMQELAGHAVRAMYYMCGVADLVAEDGDFALQQALERLWSDMTSTKMYVTGGIGARYEGEAFGDAFELPNDRAYAETCAAIGSFMWNMRMAALTCDGKYCDVAEIALYNGVLPGMSVDGSAYFYQNPLADEGRHRREPWYDVACCPPNIARLMGSVAAYAVMSSDDTIYLNFFWDGTFCVPLNDTPVRLTVGTRYPEDGEVTMEVGTSGRFGIAVRVPDWMPSGCPMSLNGETLEDVAAERGFVRLEREWEAGDVLSWQLPLKPRWIVANPRVSADQGRAAIMRGPIIYCIESADLDPGQASMSLDDFHADPVAHLDENLLEDGIGRAVRLQVRGEWHPSPPTWSGLLYRDLHEAAPRATVVSTTHLQAVPYFLWANRTPGQMRVWIRTLPYDVYQSESLTPQQKIA